ncbi:MAG: Zn-ribbon domain-containing OB-fold protein [Chloroflexi bacterium]|nr:Zn-ribbon domain-containing OB-fold protein [Chloroflexota bacterium]
MYTKPLPDPTIETKPFWDYCKKHELRMQKCAQCGHIRFPPGIVCPKCHSMEAEWVKLSGKGKIFSFVIFHYVYNKAFKDDVPYASASIELDEGPRMMSNIIGCKLEDIKINMPVEVHFEDITGEFALPKFKPELKNRGKNLKPTAEV